MGADACPPGGLVRSACGRLAAATRTRRCGSVCPDARGAAHRCRAGTRGHRTRRRTPAEVERLMAMAHRIVAIYPSSVTPWRGRTAPRGRDRGQNGWRPVLREHRPGLWRLLDPDGVERLRTAARSTPAAHVVNRRGTCPRYGAAGKDPAEHNVPGVAPTAVGMTAPRTDHPRTLDERRREIGDRGRVSNHSEDLARDSSRNGRNSSSGAPGRAVGRHHHRRHTGRRPSVHVWSSAAHELMPH